MPLFKSEHLQMFFAHIPKTGGSSVEDYLIRRFGALTMLDQNQRNRVPGRGLITSSTHLSHVDLVEFLPKNLAYSFTIVRNPVPRMISEYKFQTGHSKSTKMSFSLWLRVMIYGAQKEERIYDNHIRPQVDLIPGNTDIFRLEDGFESLINKLDQVTGTTAPDVDVKHILKKALNKEISLSRQDIEIIENFYVKDFERFGYDLMDKSKLKNDIASPIKNIIARILSHLVVAKQRYKWVH